MLRKLGFVIAALLITHTSPIAHAETGPTPDEASAVRFRAEFGLPHDLDHVAAVARDRSATLRWGVPLTVAEAAEMDRRARLADGMGPVNEFAYALPQIGGVYFDQQAGGEVVIALADEISSTERRALVSRLPADTTHRIVAVENSLSELNAIHEDIIKTAGELEQQGVDVNAVITAESANIVEVGVTGDPAAALAVLEKRYGSGLLTTFKGGGGETTHTGCYDRNHCYGPPLRAGISVAPPSFADTADVCSLAFVVNQSGQQRILTAGHSPCGNEAGTYHQDGFSIGSRQSRSWFGNETTEHADAATIGNLTDAQDDNLVYHCSPTCYTTISSAQVSDNNNIPVCLSAKETALIRCGTMINNNVSIEFPEGWLVAQREATYSLYFGDSGGAAFSQSGVAYGVQSSCISRDGNNTCTEGNVADNALYSHIQRVFAELGGSMSIYTGN